MINIFERLLSENEFEDSKAIKFPFQQKNEKVLQKLHNAINKYAKDVLPENVVFLHDATLFSSAKDGFLITTTHLYSHTIPNEPIAIEDISYIKKGKVYDYSRKKLASLEPFFDEKKAQYTFEYILNQYIKINSMIEPLLDKGVEKKILLDSAFKYFEEYKDADCNDFYKYLQDNGIEVSIKQEEFQKKQKKLSASQFNFILKFFGVENGTFLSGADKYVKYFIYLLTPLYLIMIYYKTVAGADLNSLILISFVIFSIYQPVKLMMKQKYIEFSFHGLIENEEIIQYFRYILILYISFFIPYVGFLLVIPSWWFLSQKIYTLTMNADDRDKYMVFATYLFLLALLSASMLSAIPESNLYSISTLLTLFIGIAIYAIILMPPLSLSVISTLFSGVFGMGKTILLMGLSPIKAIFTLIVIYSIMASMIGLVSSIVNAIEAHTLAFISTSMMIVISGFGAIFQIKLLVSTLKNTTQDIKKFTTISLIAFYAVMVVNMNMVDTVKTLSYTIKHKQESIFNFSKKYGK